VAEGARLESVCRVSLPRVRIPPSPPFFALQKMARSRPSTKQRLADEAYPLKNMPYSVYILLNKSRTRTYTGVAADLKKARQRERFYKPTTGRRRIREIIGQYRALPEP
jgi:hypothetical protein